jgi:type IV secretory pathway TraG/TraD family ATPase VirD4
VPIIHTVIAVWRGHNIVPIIAIQDYSQLKKVYSKEEAEAIFNMAGNFITVQVSGESAKLVSERNHSVDDMSERIKGARIFAS